MSWTDKKPPGIKPHEIKSDKDYGNCPLCHTPLVCAPGIAIYCPYDGCKVFDNVDFYRNPDNKDKTPDNPLLYAKIQF